MTIFYVQLRFWWLKINGKNRDKYATWFCDKKTMSHFWKGDVEMCAFELSNEVPFWVWDDRCGSFKRSDVFLIKIRKLILSYSTLWLSHSKSGFDSSFWSQTSTSAFLSKFNSSPLNIYRDTKGKDWYQWELPAAHLFAPSISHSPHGEKRAGFHWEIHGESPAALPSRALAFGAVNCQESFALQQILTSSKYHLFRVFAVKLWVRTYWPFSEGWLSYEKFTPNLGLTNLSETLRNGLPNVWLLNHTTLIVQKFSLIPSPERYIMTGQPTPLTTSPAKK